jgi:hypothetical protein
MTSPYRHTYIKTGRNELDDLIPTVGSFLEKDVLEMVIDGEKIRGYRSPDAPSIWIRDYSDMLRGVRYFESDLCSVVEHFAETQADNGRIFDYFTTFPEKLPSERENWTKYVRVPVEADVEYRFVKAAFLAWQAAGDDGWIASLLPKMEKALGYAFSHHWRWEPSMKLVKRPYTIDTWDFAYTGGAHDWLQFQIDDETFWGIMHGDNSGYCEACRLMSLLYDYFQKPARARKWAAFSKGLQARMNDICWNGTFYTHFVRLSEVTIPGVDEPSQLSLSNPMAINRGVATHEMAVSIIREYIRRRRTSDAFAEWFSIDPPFPDGLFGDEKLRKGAYVNGGIMPLVGGELARAAFEHGFEHYGVDILQRYCTLIASGEGSHLWYFPDGTPARVETSTSPEATSTDGWGASAMLYALLEGLAGVDDRLKLFRQVRISPRWLAAGIEKAEVQVCYEASGVTIGYTFSLEDDSLIIDLTAERSNARFHVLIPNNARIQGITANGDPIDFSRSRVKESEYADFTSMIEGRLHVEISLSHQPEKSTTTG